MKKFFISGAALLWVAIYAQAQDLSMPTDTIPQQTADPQIEAKYNTPSESYKAERNAIRSGNKLFEQEKYHQALEEYDKALSINSGSIRGRYNKAVALMQLQSEDNKGTKNDPRVQAATIFSDLVDDAKAFDKEIAEKALYNLGNIAFNDEKYDVSIEMYKASLRVNPDNLKTRENLRLAQLKKQEQEQNQDQQNQAHQQQQQQEQQQQPQEQQQEQQEQQQPQEQPMTQSAQQILQSMQNKENSTRKKVKEQEPTVGRPQSDKPW